VRALYRAKHTISDGLIRLSVRLEAFEDLQAELSLSQFQLTEDLLILRSQIDLSERHIPPRRVQ
jgi:hypothetical protein